MGNRLDGKVCIVTGGGSGMGRACAIEMAHQGGKVVVTDIKRDEGEGTAAAIAAEGGEAIFIECDLRNGEAIKALIDAAAKKFDGVDVVLNNAAVHPTVLSDKTSIEELEDDVWDAVCEINLRAAWLTTKYAVPYLKHSKGASIVNVASTGALVAYPMASVYCATKGGIVMLTKAAAVDLAKYGIRVNCYCPGTVDTPMTQKYIEAADDKAQIMRGLVGAHLVHRLGKPEEIAKLACFLASDDSSWITGASYVIDGGALAWRGTME
jgi:NAD(P)-dependent dehydrogenase (short-subunit alcohol dehydrogenase family)